MIRTRQTWPPRLLMAIPILMLALGCSPNRQQASGEDQPSVTQVADPSDVLSEELMIPLSQAKNFHHIADVHLSDGNQEQAAMAIRQILTLKFPTSAPEREDVINDARARLGKLLILSGKLEEALKVVDDGISAAGRESFFLANLHTVRGEILEASAVAVESEAVDGKTEAARERRKQAIEAFSTSNEIHERLLDKVLNSPGGSPVNDAR